MSKQKPAPARKDKVDDRVIFSARLTKAMIARVKAYGIATDRTNQDLAEAAIEKYLRELKLSADQLRKVKVLLGE